MNESPIPSYEAREYDFLAGGGEMGERIRSTDWSKTELGPVEHWPQSLKTIVRIMLTSRQPIWIGWGPQLIKLYNDPYKAIVGGKHPEALGQPTSVVWREIWHDIAPMLDQVMFRNEGTYVESQLLVMERYGYPEETYYTFSYNPVPSEQGGVAGMICTNTDDTQRVIGERQLGLLRTLAAETADARSFTEVCDLAARSLAHNQHDLPFALLYLVDQENQTVQLAGTAGISAGHELAPQTVALDEDSPWPFAEVLRSGKVPLLCDLRQVEAPLPTGAWKVPPHQAVALLIPQSGETGKAGILIAGLNPLRRFDDYYQGFIDLLVGQIASSIAHAQAYEEERRRSEALAEIDRAKTTFFSNVSHEFRTPLTLMLGPIEDELNDPEANLAQRERMDVAHRNAIRLLKLVNTLLDFSRIEAGRMQAFYEPLDLAAYTADLASGFRSTIEKAGMELIVDCPALTEPVYVDREMWEKVVLNLISNAFKFTLAGRITIRLRQNELSVELAVEDTGVGIPPHELPHVFERFHRVQGAAGRSYEGTGIGLSLVQELVKLHGGEIGVTSEHGAGTRFTVTIPLGAAHLPTERIAAERTSVSAGAAVDAYIAEALRGLSGYSQALQDSADGTAALVVPLLAANDQPANNQSESPAAGILLADDNADMRAYISRLLNDHYTVRAVSDGVQALAAAKAERPDLILTDVMMPIMNGFELLRALRDDPETRTIPVIMLSARAGEEARIEGAHAGADDYLVKPFSARELLARVGAQLKVDRIRKEAERAVQVERQHLYELFMQAPAVVAVLKGPQHVFDLANPLYMQLVGPTRDIIGKTVLEALPEIAGQGFDKLLDQVYETGEPFIGNEVTVELDRAGDGQLESVFLNFVYQPYTDEHDQIQGVLVHAVDVTEQVYARRHVEESEERLASILETMPQFAWTTEPDGSVDYYNQRWYEYTGTIPEQTLGFSWTAFVHPDDLTETAAQWRRALETGESLSVEYRLLGKDGSYRWFVGQALPLHNSSGRIIKWIGTNTDIEAQKELERRKDEFIALASHELKTPITSLKMSTQLLQRRLQKELTPLGVGTEGFAEKQLGRMNEQLNRLAELVNDLLDVSKIEAGKLDYDMADVDIGQLVGDFVDELRLISERQLIDSIEHDTIILSADKERVRQVLTNLVTNAIKYSPQADRVIVRSQVVEGEILVSVQDFGIGIPGADKERIFDRFFQVRDADAGGGTYPGLGLGLYISAQIVKRHGGRIWVESARGKGSTFHFTLPLVLVDITATTSDEIYTEGGLE